MPVEMGGLDLEPATIGYIIAIYGTGSGLFQLLFFAKLVRRFGTRKIFIISVSTFVPIFLMLPIVSLITKQWGLCWTVQVIGFCILVLLFLMDTGYGKFAIWHGLQLKANN